MGATRCRVDGSERRGVLDPNSFIPDSSSKDRRGEERPEAVVVCGGRRVRATVLSSEALIVSGRTALTFKGEASLARVEVMDNGDTINALTVDAPEPRLGRGVWRTAGAVIGGGLLILVAIRWLVVAMG